jgi:hypothetical protein
MTQHGSANARVGRLRYGVRLWLRHGASRRDAARFRHSGQAFAVRRWRRRLGREQAEQRGHVGLEQRNDGERWCRKRHCGQRRGAGNSQAGVSSTAGSSAGGAPPKPADTNLPFTEDFEDGEPNGFISWNEDLMAGAWAVVDDAGNKVYQPQAAVGELEFAVGGSTAWTDVVFSAKVRLNDADSDAQIVVRFTPPKTYLVVEMAVGKFKLRGRADGSTQDLIAPSPKPVIAAGTWYTVAITAKGNMVSLTLDGMAIGSTVAANDAISNGGIALGVAEGSVSFDDLSVVAAP